MELDDQSFSWSLSFNGHLFTTRLLLLRGRLHLVRDTAAEKEFDIVIQMTLEHVSSKIQENRNKRKD